MGGQKSAVEIEKYAVMLRKLLGVSLPDAPDMITVIAELSSVIPEFSFQRHIDEELPEELIEAPAMADCMNKIIHVRESLYQNLLRGDTRARMTIAHEIGHIVLGHTGNRFRKDQKGKIFGKTKIEEREADIFASRFFAPTSKAVTCDSAHEIAEKFQISQTAADIRYKELSSVRGHKIPDKTMDIIEEMRKRWKKDSDRF